MKYILNQMSNQEICEWLNAEQVTSWPVIWALYGWDVTHPQFEELVETNGKIRLYVDGYHYEDDWFKIISFLEKEACKRGTIQCVDFDTLLTSKQQIWLPDGAYMASIDSWGCKVIRKIDGILPRCAVNKFWVVVE